MHVSVRNPIRRIDPVSGGASAAQLELYEPAPRAGGWAIVEDEPEVAPSPPPRTRVDRRACLVLAIAGSIVGFGFAGPDRGASADAEAEAAARAGITLAAPAAGAAVTGRPLEVAGVADQPIRRLALEVRAAGVTVGAADVRVAAAGPFTARIPVLAPPVALQAELVVSVTEESEVLAFRVPFSLSPAGPVGVWDAEVTQSSGRSNLAISGFATAAMGSVAIDVSTRATGSALASVRVPVAPDPRLPGSGGGWALGVGSFRADLPLPPAWGGEAIRVTVSWRDEAAGGWGSLWTSLPGRSGPRRPPRTRISRRREIGEPAEMG